MMKTVTMASPVDEKLYLDMDISSFLNGSWKNYFVRSEEMKMKSPISTPKFVIAVSESSTVESRILKESQDLMILKILNNLNALSTERLELELSPSEAMMSSTKLIMTMKASKTLNPSLTYWPHPKPNNLRTISIAKMTVKKRFAISLTLSSHLG